VSRARALALGTDEVAQAAAAARLADGGGALDAVLAGYFAVGGASGGVLLAPLAILVGGVGQGTRAFDGRPRQPGRGARRPRGFLAEDVVPEAARLAIPGSLPAALVAHAYGTSSLRSVVQPGIAAAARAGAKERQALLQRIGEVGAAALLEPAYRRGLLRRGGAPEGGLVSPGDFDTAMEGLDHPGTVREIDGARFLVPAWEPGPGSGSVVPASAVVAIDAHGVCAALAYGTLEDGVWIAELDLLAPKSAIPVMRGVPRTAPGLPLGRPFALGIRLDEQERPVEILAEPGASALGEQPVLPRIALRRDPATRLVRRA